MIERKPEVATGVIIENDKNEIFLGKSTKYDGLWIVPGGHLKYGETLKDCVRREVEEELGIELAEVHFLRVQESIRPSEYKKDPGKHFVFINFFAKMVDPTAQIILDPKEYSAYCFILPNKALEQLELNSSTREFVSYYLQQKREA